MRSLSLRASVTNVCRPCRLPNLIRRCCVAPNERQKLAPTARPRVDRIKVGNIATVLSIFVLLTAEHPAQAENGLRVENLHDLGYVGSANALDGRRCEMSPEEFAKFYPPLFNWIRTTLTTTAHMVRPVASRGFSRLPLYFTEELLESTKVVLVDQLPIPPLAAMGLMRFADFERGIFDGITYMDTFFLKPIQSDNEKIYFHELVHVIQWRLLGPSRFLLAYANGLECFGYRQSPLEAMAYDAEVSFANSTAIFNVEKLIADKLGL